MAFRKRGNSWVYDCYFGRHNRVVKTLPKHIKTLDEAKKYIELNPPRLFALKKGVTRKKSAETYVNAILKYFSGTETADEYKNLVPHCEPFFAYFRENNLTQDDLLFINSNVIEYYIHY